MDVQIEENTKRFIDIKKRIAIACEKSNREPSEVKLVLVTKTIDLDIINSTLEHWLQEKLISPGEVILGENKVQEAHKKFEHWKSNSYFSNNSLTNNSINSTLFQRHFIGHLQTNKTNKILPLIDLIHSLDRWSLLHKLLESPQPTTALLQVNISGEESKFGWSPDELPQVFKLLQSEQSQPPSLTIKGFMTMAPLVASHSLEQARRTFVRLRALQQTYLSQHSRTKLTELSMGMSHDFEVAIEEGATFIRIGSAIFGERTYT